jgi:hypothetical protein
MRPIMKPKRKAKPDTQLKAFVIEGLTAEAEIERLHAVTGELLGTLKNIRAWMVKNKLQLPPISLTGLDLAIAKAERAGIKVPEGQKSDRQAL